MLVALPEELPVNETLDLYQRLGAMRTQVGLCVLNEMHPEPFSELQAWPALRTALESSDPATDEALRLTDRRVARAQAQRSARERLNQNLPVPYAELPFLYHRRLTPSELLALGRSLVGDA